MAVSVSYNSVSMPVLGKLRFSGGERTISYTFETYVSNASSTAESLREWNKTLTITGAGIAKTFSLSTNAAEIKLEVGKSGSQIDSKSHKRLQVTAVIQLQNSIPGYNGIRQFSASQSRDEQTRLTITIQGEATANGVVSAYTNANAQLAGVTTAALGFFGISTDPESEDYIPFEAPRDVINASERNNKIATFTRNLTELLNPENRWDTEENEAIRDDTIIFPVWSVSRERPTSRENEAEETQYFNVSWQARFSKDAGAPISKVENSVRAYIISRIKSDFSDASSLTLLSDNITYDPTQQTASNTWRVRVDSGLVEYSEEIGLDFQYAQFDKITDGQAHTFAEKTPGLMGTVTQSARIVRSDLVAPVLKPPVLTLPGGAQVRRKTLSLRVKIRNYYLEAGADPHKTELKQEVTTTVQASYQIVKPETVGNKYRILDASDALGGEGLG